jgi:hypothetical protein
MLKDGHCLLFILGTIVDRRIRKLTGSDLYRRFADVLDVRIINSYTDTLMC